MTRDLAVSIVLTTFNRADLLPRAIRSVLGQTYQNLECIVVDDASTDNTAAVVEQFDDNRLVCHRHETNRGASATRNTGISDAQGEFIAFLDDDDEWLPTKLEKQVPLLVNSPSEVGMLYCWMDYYGAEGHLMKEHHPTYKGYVFPLVLDSQRIGGCSTLLVRRSVIEKVGGFDESLPRGNDGDFIRRVCQLYEVDFVPEVLVKVYVGHSHIRITRSDEQGIRNAIKGHKAKLTKFKKELDDYPQQTANILAAIAYHYGELGDWRSAFAFYGKAISTHRLSLRPYVSLFRALKSQIMRWNA